LISKKISHYHILEEIGRGGMGIVYKAEDTKLKRPVALKFLPPHLTQDTEAKRRFIQEARAASALQHTNICTIYEINETDEDQIYISMEYLEGKTLREKIKEGLLTPEETIDIVKQVTRGLAKAHQKDIVHRDIKPANLIVTDDGVVKIVDFGLAKLTGQTKLTKTGSTLGTAAYMSPEQSRGEDVDHRTDIWSFGVVLYEMLCGQLPFKGDYEQAVIYSIVNEEPEPLRKASPAVPMELERVVHQILAKKPADRYQTMEALREDLVAVTEGHKPHKFRSARGGRIFGMRKVYGYAVLGLLAILFGFNVGGVRDWLLRRSAPPARAIRLAVLPFANLTGDPDQEYLSDGFTQELISQLGRLHPGGLSVIARSSVMRYKQGDTPIDQIGRELRVDYVLEGSTRREVERIRISADLIQVGDQTPLWGDTYEREFSGILALQSEVAENVARALALKLLPAEQVLLTSARTVDPEAYDAFLKGTYHWQKVTREDLYTAERYFELALEKDPAYAPAYSGLANVWAVRQQMSITPPHEAGPKAKAAALEAIRLDDNSSDAHEALAGIRTWTDWDWAGAEPEWRRALELDPNAANTHAYFAHFLAIIGHVDEAIPHSERALELDPFNALFHGLYSKVLCFDRRYDDALAAARTALAMQPGLPAARNTLQDALIAKGMRNEHLALQREWMARDPELVAALEQGLAGAGYEGAMRHVADLLAARYEKSGGFPDPGSPRLARDPRLIAKQYLGVGDYDRAVEWLEKAYGVHHPSLPYVGFYPIYDPLRGDPRFQDLLRKMNLPTGE